MTRALLVPLLTMFALATWPPAPLQQNPHLVQDVKSGACVRKLVTYTAFLPVRLQVALADAGFPITPTLQPYKRLQGRAWQCAYLDGGSQLILPRLVAAAEYFRPDLTTIAACTDATLCPAAGDDGNEADDGGTDALADVAFECACSNGNVLADGGATCRQTVDGGNAPLGVTLRPGAFLGPGCKPKSCGTLFFSASLPDGGAAADSSWPAVCPVQ